MDRIRLGMVGCGGMGTRHLYDVELCALAAFAATTPNSLLLRRRLLAETAA